MASKPPLSYRNAALLPPQTNVSIYVDVPPLLRNNFFANVNKTRTLSEDYILRCLGHAAYLAGIQLDMNYWDRYLMYSNYEEALGTFVYEDHTLREMASPESPAYKKLEDNLKWIASELQCHVTVFVGHVETCKNYIETIYKKTIEDLKFYSSLPTIFLIIACHGDKIAFQLNSESKYSVFRKHKIAFFGFKDLLHIHEGDMYSTKLFDVAHSKAICDSEEMVSLLSSLNVAYEAAGIEPTSPFYPEVLLDVYRKYPDLEVFKCCKAKLGRLYSDFVKGLERRKTTRYTKEILKTKFEPFVKESKKLTEEYTTITSKIGIDCDENPCNIPNLYEAQELEAQEYNKKGSFHTLFRELKSLIRPNYIYENSSYTSQADFHKSVEQFYRKIQDLKGKEMSVFTYTPNFDSISPILFDLLFINHSFEAPEYPLFKTFRFILQKYGSALDFTLRTPQNGTSILHEILRSTAFTEKEEYILFKTIYDLVSDETEREALFFSKEKFGNIPFTYPPMFRPLICMLYIEKFGTKLKSVRKIHNDKGGNLLHFLCIRYIPHEDSEYTSLLLDCAKGLLTIGIDPNEKLIETIRVYTNFIGQEKIVPTLKPLELNASLYLPPYNPTLFSLFLRYGMTNDTLFFTKERDFYVELAKNDRKLTSFRKVITAIFKYVEAFENDQNYTQSGGMPRYYNSNNNNNNSPYYSNYNDYNDREERIIYLLSRDEHDLYDKKLTFMRHFPSNWQNYKKNTSYYLNHDYKIIPTTIQLFNDSLQSRKGIKKHGSKVRRTYKSNKLLFNKTMKNTFNTIAWNMNGEKMIGDYLGKILELAKRKEFTKEEKALYKKKPINIQKSTNLQPKDKYLELKKLFEQMQEVLKTR